MLEIGASPYRVDLNDSLVRWRETPEHGSSSTPTRTAHASSTTCATAWTRRGAGGAIAPTWRTRSRSGNFGACSRPRRDLVRAPGGVRRSRDVTQSADPLYVELDKGGSCARARVGFGGLASGPRRSPAAEAQLVGCKVGDDQAVASAMSAAAEELATQGDLWADPAYRAHLIRTLGAKMASTALRRASGQSATT